MSGAPKATCATVVNSHGFKPSIELHIKLGRFLQTKFIPCKQSLHQICSGGLWTALDMAHFWRFETNEWWAFGCALCRFSKVSKKFPYRLIRRLGCENTIQGCKVPTRWISWKIDQEQPSLSCLEPTGSGNFQSKNAFLDLRSLEAWTLMGKRLTWEALKWAFKT